MREFIQKKKIDVPSDVAFFALKQINKWIFDVDIIKDITYEDDNKEFCVKNRKFKLTYKDGTEMEAIISEINETGRYLKIEKKHSLIKIDLYFKVNELGDGKCELVRKYTYNGIVGSIFTYFNDKDENIEFSEYLDVWEKYAKNL